MAHNPHRTKASFTPLQTYKVLKHTIYCIYKLFWFYTITNLQGSQTRITFSFVCIKFYTITNLQGSQTSDTYKCAFDWFYTITNLQGSQTSNEIITEPNILVNMCKLPSNV